MSSDGMTYAPRGRADPVCGPGEFRFGAVGLDHGHIYGMCNGLVEAGGEVSTVYDPDPVKVAAFVQRFPGTLVARCEAEVLEDPTVQMVASGAIPGDRSALGVQVLNHSKDYFVDKPPLTTLEQLTAARTAVAETGQKYAVYYSERVHVEAAVLAGQLVDDGAIGRVIQVIGLGPHRLDLPSRPPWFFEKERYGGILCDIGSHQIEQFLSYSGATSAEITGARIANYHHKDHPGLEDFGDCSLVADNGAVGYFRVDWFTPKGLGSWGDGRTFVLGTDGYLELRKYVDIARDPVGDHVYLVDHRGEHHLSARGTVGFPYFGQLIRDCLDRTETAMSQEHAFSAAELCIRAEQQALRVE